MGKSYEYSSCGLESIAPALFGVSDKVRVLHEDVVREHARDGWRIGADLRPRRRCVRRREVLRADLRMEHAEHTTALVGASRARRSCRTAM